MALPTTAARSAACHSCRQWVLRSFIASIGGSGVLPVTPQNAQRRTFAASTEWRYPRQRGVRREVRDDFALNEINDGFAKPVYGKNIIEKASAAERISEDREHVTSQEPEALEKDNIMPEVESAAPQQEHVPWYLQVDPPMPTQENTFSVRQKLPDLPPHSPAILEPLLSQISIDLGLDDLTILDLRTLDPPPALGANLLMLIGTARSEKHLHVSADKLCRWLRSQYKLSPFADGLLGRQELKLKLRRKAKRSKLMSAVGGKSTAETELDEGIRTGWVCVNVGRVEGGDLPKTEAELAREKNFIGFGKRSTGSRIVVQMMTEEKRGELDLEKLWATIQRKSDREKQALLAEEEATDASTAATEGSNAVQEDVVGSGPQSQAYIQPPPQEGFSHLRGMNGQRGKARGLHTYASRFRQAFFSDSDIRSGNDDLTDLEFEQSMALSSEENMPRDTTKPIDVQRFLETWHSYPQTFTPRSRELYVSFFKALGEGKLTPLSNEDSIDGDTRSASALLASGEDKSVQAEAYSRAREFLRDALADMGAEDPVVSFDAVRARGETNGPNDMGGAVDLAMGILRSIRFVDPENRSKEWHDMRSRCEVFLRRVLRST